MLMKNIKAIIAAQEKYQIKSNYKSTSQQDSVWYARQEKSC